MRKGGRDHDEESWRRGERSTWAAHLESGGCWALETQTGEADVLMLQEIRVTEGVACCRSMGGAVGLLRLPSGRGRWGGSRGERSSNPGEERSQATGSK